MAAPGQIDSGNTASPFRGRLREYYELTKPRVVALLVFTAVVGMFLATPGMVPLDSLVFGTLGIGLGAASGAVINQVIDLAADSVMHRTRRRPLPTQQVSVTEAVVFGIALGALSMAILLLWVNWLTAALTFLSLIGYAVIYTAFLKRITPQNIVIGGAAGASPPILGWTAVTGQLDPSALWLFLIVFVWTPPHFWALALYRKTDYARAGIPMLPVTHGSDYTRLQILLYSLMLFPTTVMPFVTGMSGWWYLAATVPLNGLFLYHAWGLYRNYSDLRARKAFGYSIQYLALLFGALLIDHYL
ncbi:MAG: heme o synthase [Gammaproteobacteria bacterium]|nr:heme o synthase [Gammaproteobacteria bacterium]